MQIRRAMLMRSFAFALLLVVSVSSVQAASPSHTGANLSQAELLRPWLAPHSAWNPEAFSHFLGILRKDPEVARLIEKAKAIYGVEGDVEWMPLFELISEDEAHGTGGSVIYEDKIEIKVEVSAKDRFKTHEPAVLGRYIDRIRSRHAFQPGDRIEFYPNPIVIEASLFRRPKIHLLREMTLGRAIEIFVHELTHYVFNPPKDPDMEPWETPEAFSKAFLLTPGGEADAFIAGARARIRASRQLPDSVELPLVVDQWFDRDGAFKGDRAALPGILEDWLGYDYSAAYRQFLVNDRERASREQKAYWNIPYSETGGIENAIRERAAALKKRIHEMDRRLLSTDRSF